MEIHERLKQIRKEKQFTQEYMASALSTTQQQYSKYENGVQELPARRIIEICKVLGISADWLLGLKEE